MKEKKNIEELQFDQLNQKQRDAVLGEQIKNLLTSDVGEYLLQRIEQFCNEGIKELVRADAEDPTAIRNAQNKVMVADQIKNFLAQGIERGDMAMAEISEQDQ